MLRIFDYHNECCMGILINVPFVELGDMIVVESCVVMRGGCGNWNKVKNITESAKLWGWVCHGRGEHTLRPESC